MSRFSNKLPVLFFALYFAAAPSKLELQSDDLTLNLSCLGQLLRIIELNIVKNVRFLKEVHLCRQSLNVLLILA